MHGTLHRNPRLPTLTNQSCLEFDIASGRSSEENSCIEPLQSPQEHLPPQFRTFRKSEETNEVSFSAYSLSLFAYSSASLLIVHLCAQAHHPTVGKGPNGIAASEKAPIGSEEAPNLSQTKLCSKKLNCKQEASNCKQKSSIQNKWEDSPQPHLHQPLQELPIQ